MNLHAYGEIYGKCKIRTGEKSVIAALEIRQEKKLALILKWVPDQDSSAPILFAQYLPGIEMLWDPGHIKKNFKRSLSDIMGTSKAYDGFVDRVAKFF